MAKYFFVKLNSPRPTFPGDMSDEERATMQQHGVYWRGMMDRGKVVVFGPVLDPHGVFGMGVMAVESEDEVAQFVAADPAARICRIEFHPMQAVTPA
jgi:uncharacterized protein YciI